MSRGQIKLNIRVLSEAPSANEAILSKQGSASTTAAFTRLLVFGYVLKPVLKGEGISRTNLKE